MHILRSTGTHHRNKDNKTRADLMISASLEMPVYHTHLPLERIERVHPYVDEDGALRHIAERLTRPHERHARRGADIVQRIMRDGDRAAEQRHYAAQARQLPAEIGQVAQHADQGHLLCASQEVQESQNTAGETDQEVFKHALVTRVFKQYMLQDCASSTLAQAKHHPCC